MTEVPFDTMAAMRRLEAKGFNSDQAEAITETVREGVTGGVATKGDLSALESRLTLRIVVVSAALGGIVITAVGWML